MNSVNVTGRLLNDPVRRDTTRGVVAEFRLTVDGRTTVRIDIETWGHVAGAVATHLVAGRHVAVSGRWAQREYHDRDHNKRHRDYVIADRLTYLDRPGLHRNGDETAPRCSTLSVGDPLLPPSCTSAPA